MAAEKNLSEHDKYALSTQLCYTAPTKQTREEITWKGIQIGENLSHIDCQMLTEYSQEKLKHTDFKNKIKAIWRELLEA